MNLADALAATESDRGPRSNLERYLATLDEVALAQVTAELLGPREQSHLARALTLLARAALDDKPSISPESIGKWRRVHGS